VSYTPTCVEQFSPFSQNHQGQFLQDFRRISPVLGKRKKEKKLYSPMGSKNKNWWYEDWDFRYPRWFEVVDSHIQVNVVVLRG
jgi:hypothetical protein